MNRRDGFTLAACALVMFAASCSGNDNSTTAVPSTSMPVASPADRCFEDVAGEKGIDFTWRSGHRDRFLLPESIGGGAALFDMDNDGDLDAYLVQAGSLSDPNANESSKLFRNRGDGTFEDVSVGSGADIRGYGMGAACGDYDNDGDTDLFVTAVGRSRLLRNDGAGRFTDVTDSAGVAGPGIWSTSAAFLDYDADGDLDLFACNYVNWSPQTERDCYNDMGAKDYCDPGNYDAPTVDSLFRNNGDGTFTDVSLEAGLDAYPGTGLGVACADFNGDGRIDIYVANDGRPNAMWINEGNGRFHNEALERGCAVDEEGKAKAGMGVMAIDLDDDADRDLLICNLRRESDSLFVNNDGRYFIDGTAAAKLRGPTRRYTRFGLGVIDFNNDGLLDAYETSGRVQRIDSSHSDDPYAEPNLLLRGIAAGVFEDVAGGGTNPSLIHTSRGAAFGDIDNDGGVDVLVVNRDAPAYLLRNVSPSRGHWLLIRVLDEHGRDALGATLTLRIGDRTISRDVQTAYSMIASNDPRVHVGLGEANAAENVQVRWIDGTTQDFGRLDPDRVHTLQRAPR